VISWEAIELDEHISASTVALADKRHALDPFDECPFIVVMVKVDVGGDDLMLLVSHGKRPVFSALLAR
ncbi:MAG: hypothetical protein AB1651_19595, partial [Pseudomonadota bacterium]